MPRDPLKIPRWPRWYCSRFLDHWGSSARSASTNGNESEYICRACGWAGIRTGNALYIEELDIDAYYDRLRKAGARIMDALAPRPWGQREFTVEDAAGNWLTFWSKV